tara:strand:+ start:624 stop:1085 length:462 start_codon:yes stop_codon:yes gene_type:complete
MIGVLKSEINKSDQNVFLINSLNKLTKETTTQNCLFCNEVDPTLNPRIMTNVLPRIHMLYFKDILITDDLTEAQSLQNIPNAKRRFIYLYHLEWPYIEQLSFTHIKSILLNDDIGLIARSVTHAKLITQLFKKPEYIMPEWNYKTLIEIDHNE